MTRPNNMSSMTVEDRIRKAREAFRLANDLQLDLLTGTRVYDLLQRRLSEHHASETIEIGIRRMCLWYVILTLSKWIEFYDKYKAFIPSEVQDEAADLRRVIEQRGIRDFRNNTVGHIWDDKTNMPLTIEEGQARVQSILGSEDIDGFMRWVNDPKENQFPRNVISIVERVRDGIKQANGFAATDLT